MIVTRIHRVFFACRRFAQFLVEPWVARHALARGEHVLGKFAPILVTRVEQSLSLAGGVSDQHPLVRAGIENVGVACLADLDRQYFFLQGEQGIGAVAADHQCCDNFAIGVFERLVMSYIIPTEELCPATIGFALQQMGQGRMIAFEGQTDGATAVFLAHRGGDADKIIAIADEDRGDAMVGRSKAVH